MIQLLPPVCRDCGKSAQEAALSPYLDFHLCGACIARREREVLQVERRPRRKSTPAKDTKKPATKKGEATGRKKTRKRR